MPRKHTEGKVPPAGGGNSHAGRGRPPKSLRGGRESTPIKVDDRLPPLLNSLADWLNDYQYRVLLRLVIREVVRQGITLPDYKQAVVDQLLAELGDDPEDTGKLKPVPMPGP